MVINTTLALYVQESLAGMLQYNCQRALICSVNKIQKKQKQLKTILMQINLLLQCKDEMELYH